MTKTNKNNKKRGPRDPKKSIAVKWVALQFECSTAYVYGVIAGTHSDGKADEILAAYRAKYADLQKILS